MSLVSFVLVVADQLLFTEQPVGGEVGPLRSWGAEPQADPERRSAMRGSRPRGCRGASQARWATGEPATGVRAGLRRPAHCSRPCTGPGRAPPHLCLPRRRPHTARLLRSCPRGLLSLPLVHAVSKGWATRGGGLVSSSKSLVQASAARSPREPGGGGDGRVGPRGGPACPLCAPGGSLLQAPFANVGGCGAV